ncbi:MAG: PHD finger domain-containing protein [Promethearchaeati archaeon]
MGDWKDLYSEVRKRKMEALNKKDVVEAVEKHGKILAIEGEYEKPDKIIEHIYAAEKQFVKKKNINKEIRKLDFDRFDVVLIGCSGRSIPAAAYPKIKEYVVNGGWLLTTDWAIESIVEAIFPGYIRWNREKTADAVVSCQIVEPDHPFLHGLVGELEQSKWASKNTKKDEFKWWLEVKSFPIQIINYDQVKVLLNSWEIKKEWGEGPVLVYFNYGKNGGRVIHMISHTHLQKGGKKGKYASALILTNILDEKVSQKMGMKKSSGYTDTWHYTQQGAPQYNTNSPPLEEQWVNPDPQENYVTPSNVQGALDNGMGLTTTSQIVEVDPKNPSFSYGSKCVVCGYDFGEYTEKIYKCKECGAPYHQNCLNRQINEGVCKKCGRILLW